MAWLIRYARKAPSRSRRNWVLEQEGFYGDHERKAPSMLGTVPKGGQWHLTFMTSSPGIAKITPPTSVTHTPALWQQLVADTTSPWCPRCEKDPCRSQLQYINRLHGSLIKGSSKFASEDRSFKHFFKKQGKKSPHLLVYFNISVHWLKGLYQFAMGVKIKVVGIITVIWQLIQVQVPELSTWYLYPVYWVG